jgi:hypothetical protein
VDARQGHHCGVIIPFLTLMAELASRPVRAGPISPEALAFVPSEELYGGKASQFMRSMGKPALIGIWAVPAF